MSLPPADPHGPSEKTDVDDPPAPTFRRFWRSQLSHRHPGRRLRTPIFVAAWSVLAAAAAITGAVTGNETSALAFVAVALGLVLTTVPEMFRDAYADWVAPFRLVGLAVLIVGIAIKWTN